MLKTDAELKEQVKSLLDKATDAAVEHEPDLDTTDEIKLCEKRLVTITAAKEQLEARQREADTEKGQSEDDDQQSQNPDGSANRGPKYKRKFGATENSG